MQAFYFSELKTSKIHGFSKTFILRSLHLLINSLHNLDISICHKNVICLSDGKSFLLNWLNKLVKPKTNLLMHCSILSLPCVKDKLRKYQVS